MFIFCNWKLSTNILWKFILVPVLQKCLEVSLQPFHVSKKLCWEYSFLSFFWVFPEPYQWLLSYEVSVGAVFFPSCCVISACSALTIPNYQKFSQEWLRFGHWRACPWYRSHNFCLWSWCCWRFIRREKGAIRGLLPSLNDSGFE